MKNLYIVPAFLMFATAPLYAAEFQCDISSTRAAHCEPYYEVKHTCAFPTALNEERTTQLEIGKASYPDFCTLCGLESGIPKECQKGRISSVTEVSGFEKMTNEVSEEAEDSMQENTIIENALGGFKIVIGVWWDWLKVALKGERFEIENDVTPVAGVRG